jgi:hypothetical protein
MKISRSFFTFVRCCSDCDTHHQSRFSLFSYHRLSHHHGCCYYCLRTDSTWLSSRRVLEAESPEPVDAAVEEALCREQVDIGKAWWTNQKMQA